MGACVRRRACIHVQLQSRRLPLFTTLGGCYRCQHGWRCLSVSAPAGKPKRSVGRKAGLSDRALTQSITASKDLPALLHLVETHVGNFNVVHCSAALVALARLRPAEIQLARESAALESLQAKATELLPEMEPRAIANVLWALATCERAATACHASTMQRQFAGPELLRALASQILLKLEHFNSQDFSNSFWALAALAHHPGEDFMRTSTHGSELRLREFTPQNLANVLWAFATLLFDPGEAFLNVALIVACSRIADFKPQHLSNSLWALAKLEHRPSDPFLAASVREAARKLKLFNPQNISNLLWAYSQI